VSQAVAASQQTMPAMPHMSVPTANTAGQVAASETVHLQVKEWSFEPKSLLLPAGQPVTLVLGSGPSWQAPGCAS
jgi:hypothetical protein